MINKKEMVNTVIDLYDEITRLQTENADLWEEITRIQTENANLQSTEPTTSLNRRVYELGLDLIISKYCKTEQRYYTVPRVNVTFDGTEYEYESFSNWVNNFVLEVPDSLSKQELIEIIKDLAQPIYNQQLAKGKEAALTKYNSEREEDEDEAE